MRSRNKFQRSLAIDRVDRNPHADILPSFNVVVRLVLVPWSRLVGTGLLDQQVIVVKPASLTLH